MSGRIGNWGARHAHALVSTLGQLARDGLATSLTVLAISLALALPLALGVLIANVRGVGADLSAALGVSVYLKTNVAEPRSRALAAQMRRRPGVASVSLVTAAQGLALLRQQSGLGAALDTVTDNPLPAVLEIHPTASASSPAQLEALRAALAAMPEVDQVQLDRDWAVRFNALVALVRELLRVSAVLLAAGVVAVVGNTVRLEIQARGDEIEVTKLVGGSNAFVRRPFLYAGGLYGALAALLAFGIVSATRVALAGPVGRLAAAYGSAFVLRGPDLRALGLVLAAGAALGWLGAAIAAGRQLARSAPRTD